jgi:hypothetical protein
MMWRKLFKWGKPVVHDGGAAEGIRLAELSADKAGDDWQAEAYRAFVDYARQSKYFTTEQVRSALNGRIEPHDRRAWGHIAKLAQRNGIVVQHDLVRGGQTHGRYVIQWQSTLLP